MSENQETGTTAVTGAQEQTADDVFECNKALIEEMRAKHGEIEVLRQPGLPGVIVVATPSRAAYRTFSDQVNNDKVSNATAAENFAIASVVHPDTATFKTFLDKKPGLASKITVLAQQLAGVDADVLGKG